MENTRSRGLRPSQGKCRTRMWNTSNQANTRSPLFQEVPHKQKEKCSKCGDSTHLEGFQCPAKRYQCKSCPKIWALHKLVLHERPAKTSISQAPQTKNASADCRYNTSTWQSSRIKEFR